jgi:outer membrane lipoprotein-sorting protein
LPKEIFLRLCTTTSLLFIAFLLVSSRALECHAQEKEPAGLNSALNRMQAAGQNFEDFSAEFTWKKYTAVLDEFDTPETGMFYYSRAKDGTALIRQEVMSPGERILTIKEGVVTIYQPQIKQAKIATLGKDKDKAEYLALGIGQSPAKLGETFDVAYMGSETLNGTACWVLRLKPKSSRSAALYAAITIWIDESSGIPIQHKFLEPGGDYLLSSFFDIKLNCGIPGSKFEQKLPRDVEKIRIQ